MKINAAPDSLAETTLLLSGTLAHGDVQRGPVDLLQTTFDADDTLPAAYYSVLDVVIDDAGAGVAVQKMGMEPLTEDEARLNIASQLWLEISNFSGAEVVLDDLRVILRGYPAKPLPKDYTRTDAAAIVQDGDITVKDKSGVAIPCDFELTSMIGPTGTAGTPGSVWRDGSGAPSDAVGVNGDYYLDDATGDVYLRAAGTYSVVANIEGPAGDPGDDGAPGADGIFSAIASQAEAEAGTDNVKGMTPLRVAEAIAALGGGGSSTVDGRDVWLFG